MARRLTPRSAGNAEATQRPQTAATDQVLQLPETVPPCEITEQPRTDASAGAPRNERVPGANPGRFRARRLRRDGQGVGKGIPTNSHERPACTQTENGSRSLSRAATNCEPTPGRARDQGQRGSRSSTP